MSAGRVITARRPPPSRFSRVREPLFKSTMLRAIVRPEARAARSAAARAFYAEVRLEDLFEKLGRDAGAAVLDADYHAFAAPFDG